MEIANPTVKDQGAFLVISTDMLQVGAQAKWLCTGASSAIMESENRQETYIGRGGGSVLYLGGLNGTK